MQKNKVEILHYVQNDDKKAERLRLISDKSIKRKSNKDTWLSGTLTATDHNMLWLESAPTTSLKNLSKKY